MGFEIRSLLATALNTVDGMKGFERAEAASRKVGDAYPKWGGQQRVAPGAFEFTWQIVVHLPDDVVKREQWIEAHSWPITDALAHLIHVDTMTPEVQDELPVLMITGRE